jgi:hypothetical protein
MIPRTVLMAQEVSAQLTATEIEDYGNIILNGYATTGPNTTGKLAWQYSETTSAPVPLPSVTSVRPALKGWTTNYMSYFTRAQSGYSAYPGQENPFLFDVWNYYQNPGPIGATGPLLTVTGGLGGTDMIPDRYQVSVTGVSGGFGAGLYIDVELLIPGDPFSGGVTSIGVISGGSGYVPNDLLNPVVIPTVSGVAPPNLKILTIAISSDTVIPAPGYSQCPRRSYQNRVSATTPPQYVNNPEVIAHSFIHPIQTKQTPPPIDTL